MKPQDRRASSKGLGCLILFALPFAAVGVGVGVWLVLTIVAHLQMRSWVEVPARIVRAELETSQGEDSSTCKATAEYEYAFRDQQYSGKRVGLSGGSDNIGSFQQDAYRELSNYQRSGKPFRCYVNPDCPSEAVLYRDLRWAMVGFQAMFTLVFGGVGFGMLAVGVVSHRKMKAEEALAAAHPEAPWLWKPDWTEGKILSSAKTLMLVSLAFAAFWNLVSAPLWFVLPGEIIEKGNRVALLGLAFPLIGLGLIGWAIVSVMRWRKYGQSVFQMASVPGVVGGQLAGVIRTSTKIRPEDGFRLKLNCIRKVTRADADGSSTSEEILWQDERAMTRELSQDDPDHSAIPVLFPVPYECLPTDQSTTGNEILWRLVAAASAPGLDYRATFEVPVFKTAGSDPNFVADSSALAPYAAPADPDRDLHDAGVVRTTSPMGDGWRFIFPMRRNLCLAIGTLVFFLLWSGAIALMWRLQAPLLFPIVFGLIDVLLLLLLADLWFYRSVVGVSRSGLTVQGGLFGLGRSRWIDISNVTRIEPMRGMQSGQKVYYNLVILCSDGKRVTLGKRLDGRRLATTVAEQIERAMGRR